jgi:hypothetical protein
MWMLTRDFVSTDAPEGQSVTVCSQKFRKDRVERLVRRFRLLDDDGYIQDEIIADSCHDAKAFGPKKDFGEGAWGSTAIKYWDETGQRREML